VLPGIGLCDELITRPEESYRLWCVIVCDLENLKPPQGHDPRWVAAPQQNNKIKEKSRNKFSFFCVHYTTT
jgi:hypothetical protein